MKPFVLFSHSGEVPNVISFEGYLDPPIQIYDGGGLPFPLFPLQANRILQKPVPMKPSARVHDQRRFG